MKHLMKKVAYPLGLIICFALCIFLSSCGSKDPNGGYDNSRQYQKMQEILGDLDTENPEENDSSKDNREQSYDKKETDKNANDKESATPDNSKSPANSNSNSAEKNTKARDDSNTNSTEKNAKNTDNRSSSSANSKSKTSNKKPSDKPGEKYASVSDGTDTKQDAYQTDPIPEGEKKPVEPEDVTVDKSVAGTCSLLIECTTVLDNMNKLKKGKESIIPENGIIYYKSDITFYEGESVADVLKRETRNNAVHLEFMKTPGFHSDYIEGIGNLYEFDCGPLSGWSYCVNAWFPNYGCSRYVVAQGDEIEWHYSCNRGKDISAGTGIN